MRSLYLNQNRFGDAGATRLAEALPRLTSLESLNLRFNQIGDEGVAILATVLPTPTSLLSLDLSCGNDIGLAMQNKLNSDFPNIRFTY